MNIAGVNVSKKALIFAVFLILGLAVGVYLVQTKQIFKSKASQEIYNAFEITEQD